MSRYGSLDSTIRLVEECRRILKDADSIIADLQGIAIDVRYGGKWEGDYRSIADALDKCVRMECAACPYHGRAEGCRKALKQEAAACIRQLGVLLSKKG